MKIRLMCMFGLVGFIGADAKAANILINGGLDDSPTTSITISGAGERVNTTAMPPWKPGIVSGNGTFSVIDDASAISAPHVIDIERTSGGEVHLDTRNLYDLTNNNVYRFYYWGKNNGGTANVYKMNLPLFTPSGSFLTGGPEIWAVNVLDSSWQRIENTFIAEFAPEIVGKGAFRLSLEANGDHAIFDDLTVEDITTGDRNRNGGFENSGNRLLYWNVGGDPGQMSASIVNDAAEGNNALRLVRNNTAGDPAFNNDGDFRLPWKGGHDAFVHLFVKDDPTSSTGDYVNVSLQCFDSGGNWVGNLGDHLFSGGVGYYEKHTFSSNGNIPANTAKVCITVRIVSSTGAPKAGDVILDQIIVGDLTDGFDQSLPVVLSDFATN